MEELQNWEAEATAVIADVKSHCKYISISELNRNENEIYLNIETYEGSKHSIRMSAEGFQIVGNDFSTITIEVINSAIIYETPYALLSDISAGYINSFGNDLVNKLNQIHN